MMAHVWLCLWAFVVLWKLDTIRMVDRLKLFRKTLRLYLCFRAFADVKPRFSQLRGAMIAGLFSAVYDYETDWRPVASLNDSYCLSLLMRYAPDGYPRESARALFIADWRGSLSTDGLERGSVALMFYHSLIASDWMSCYTTAEISSFGRSLQIVDDALDLDDDKQNGDVNCFLIDRPHSYVRELIQFLESEFFQALTKRSFVYRILDRRVRSVLVRLGSAY